MEVNVTQEDGVSVVTVHGRVDSSITPQIQAEMDKLLANADAQIVMDLHDVEYMSSSGVRVLVSTLKTLKDSSGGFRLANISDVIRGLLLSVGMLDLFEVHDTVSDAVASFK